MSDVKNDSSYSFEEMLVIEESMKRDPNINTIVVTLVEEMTNLHERVSYLEDKLGNKK